MSASLIDNQGIARLITIAQEQVILGGFSEVLATYAGLAGYSRAIATLVVADPEDDSDDTLDVYLDVSPDNGVTWVNAVHFDQFLGNGSGGARVAVLSASAAPPTSDQDVSSDASAGDVRPHLWGSQLRARVVIADPTGDDASYTISLSVLLQR